MTRAALPIRALLTTFLLVLAGTLLGAAPASANYTAGTATTCGGWNAGGRDRANTLYVPCGTRVLKVFADGREQMVPIDVAVGRLSPSPDGTYLYSVDGTSPMRFTRGADGSYRRDAFRFQTPAGWAERGWKVCGWGIATDAYGSIYVSNGGWCQGNPNMILKYRADGTLATAFGDYGQATSVGHLPGHFRPNMSIAVTADGARVWVADQNNYRVQYFDRAADNLSYRYAGMWSGEGTPWSGQLGAVYGVALDPWGYAYVTQTTTKIIWRLDPNGRNPVLVSNRANSTWSVAHTLAVDARGSVFVGEWKTRLDRTTAVPGPIPAVPAEPRPDVAAPVLQSVAAPAETYDASVRVTVNATDDIGVTQMRLADERGVWGAWRGWQPALDVTLSAGTGTKVVYVQVRDAAGRDSEVRSAFVVRRAQPDVADPTVALRAPATSVVNSVELEVDAADDLGVTHIRVAGEDGTWSDWRTWSSGTARLAHVTSPGSGTKLVWVQVRDASYRVSAAAQATIVVGTPQAPVAEAVVVDAMPAAAPVAPAADPVTPAADRVAPRIVSLKVAPRSCGRKVLLRLTARDEAGVRMVRVANEDGRYGRWRASAPRIRHLLSKGHGRKLVTVQVRDAAGNVSRASSRRTLVVDCSR